MTDGWDSAARNSAARRFGLDWEEFENAHELAVSDFEIGRTSLDEYINRTVFHQPRAFTRDEFKSFIWAQSHEHPEALAIVAELKARPDTTWLIHTALVYCYLGLRNNPKTLDEMELAFRAKEIVPKWDPFGDYMYDGIRADPRFATVTHEFGLDEKLFIPPNRGRPGK